MSNSGIDTASPADMGVTDNAILVLAYIMGTLLKPNSDGMYEAVSAGPGAGTAIVRHTGNGNTYRFSVVQLEGTE